LREAGARFAAWLCALLIGGVTFDGSTKDAVQCDVRDALVALKALQRKRSVLVSRTRRPMGAQGHYKGRKPIYSRKQYESAQAILGKSASVGDGSTAPYAPNGLPHQG